MPRTVKRQRYHPLEKVIIAAGVLHMVLTDMMTDKQAGEFLRKEVGLHWNLITCMQFLSGKEAIAAVEQLPDGWTDGSMTKESLEAAIKVAAHVVANVRPDGVALCASELGKSMKGKALP